MLNKIGKKTNFQNLFSILKDFKLTIAKLIDLMR